MPENDLYLKRSSASKKPVTIVLALLLVAGFALFAYETASHWQSGARTTPAGVAPEAANPNTLVPSGSGAQPPAAR